MERFAVCGLDCATCDIREATHDEAVAQSIVDWFEEELDTVVKIENVHCDGCRGERSKHWSPDCWILHCCVDQKGLEHCSQCEAFPCDKLEAWATESARYARALERLKEMNQDREE